MFNFLNLKKNISDFTTDLQVKVDDLNRKNKELYKLKNMPLPRKDVVAGLCEMIDVQTAKCPCELENLLKGVIFNPRHDFKNSRMDLKTEEYISWFFSQQIKEKITDTIMEMPFPQKVGLPLAERKPLIKELEIEVKSLTNEVDQLQEQAASLSINISAPPIEEAELFHRMEVERLKTETGIKQLVIDQMLKSDIDPVKEVSRLAKVTGYKESKIRSFLNGAVPIDKIEKMRKSYE